MSRRALTILAVLLTAAPAAPALAQNVTAPPSGAAFASPDQGSVARAAGDAAGATPAATPGWTFIPVPIFATDPNVGIKWGVLLPVFSFTERDSVMWVPSITVSETLGVTFTGRYFHHLPDDALWHFEYSQSTRQNLDLTAEARFPWLGRFGFESEWRYRKDQSQRFFGLGPDARADTSYTVRGLTGWARGWFSLSRSRRAWRAFWEESIDRPDVLYSSFDRDQTLDRHTAVPGVTVTPTVYWHTFGVRYDRRNDPQFPSAGLFAEAAWAFASRALGATFDATRETLLLRGFWALNGPDAVLGVRLDFVSVQGPAAIPFQGLATLGGHTTFRGSATGRFYDRRVLSMSLEARLAVWRLRLFGYQTKLELTPFVDFGQVFDEVGDLSMMRLRFAGGIGFRLLVEPRVQGVIDVGIGREGVRVYTTLTYPF